MQHVTSIIDERAVDPHAAQSALDRLARRSREALVWGLSALVAGTAVAVVGTYALAVPAAAGAICGLLVSLSARNDRNALLLRLVGQRSAYSIPDVARAAARMATREMRMRQSRQLTRVVLSSTGFEPSVATMPALADRVERCADELLAIAYLLARDSVKVHPASLALLERLLGSTLRSPLYNPSVPEQHLRIAMQRLRASITD